MAALKQSPLTEIKPGQEWLIGNIGATLRAPKWVKNQRTPASGRYSRRALGNPEKGCRARLLDQMI